MAPRTARTWSKQVDFPKNPDGTYTIADVVRWREAHDKPKEGQSAAERKAALDEERARIENARRRLKLRHEIGDVVSRESVQAQIESMFQRLRARLEEIPDAIAKTLPREMQAEVAANWKRRIRLIETEIAAWKLTD